MSRRSGFVAGLVVVALAATVGIVLAVRAGLGRLGRAAVPTAQAARGDFVQRVWAEGTLEAAHATNLGMPPTMRERLRIAWLAPEGSYVEAGDVVIRFDPTDLETRLIDGEAERASADARIARTEVRETSAQRNLERDAEVAGVELDYAREFQSKDPTVFSRADIVKSEIDEGLASARRDHAQDVLGIRQDLSRVEIDLLRITRRTAELKIGQARDNLEALEVRAPHAGIFLLRDDWGEVEIGSWVWPGSPLAEIPRLDELEAHVFVLEADAGGLEAGAAAEVVVEAAPDRSFAARVKSVDALAQERRHLGPVQYFATVLELERTDPALMKPGQRVEATIVISARRDAITVPRQAVFERDGRNVVYLERAGGFVAKEVQLGPAGLGRQVIESGVAAGDVVALRDPTRPGRTEREAAAEPANGPVGEGT